MPTIVWNVTLPPLPKYGYTQRFERTSLERPVDSGYPKKRQVFTKAERETDVRITLIGAQLATFDTFFHSDTSGGSLPFEYTDPFDRTTREFMFVGEPVLTGISDNVVTAAFKLRRLP